MVEPLRSLTATHGNSSQHLLVLVRPNANTNDADESREWSLQKFQEGTSSLPISIHRTPTNNVIVATNYPDCMVFVRRRKPNDHDPPRWIVLCAGLPYGSKTVFGNAVGNNDDDDNNCSSTSLTMAVWHYLQQPNATTDQLSTKLARIRGHFCLVVVDNGGGCYRNHPQKTVVHVWNDVFGLMPVFSNKTVGGISTYWDCLLPPPPPPITNSHPPAARDVQRGILLDWKAIAHYLTMGTTIGTETFVQDITNRKPGCHVVWETIASVTRRATPSCPHNKMIICSETPYVQTYGGCELILTKSGGESDNGSIMSSTDLCTTELRRQPSKQDEEVSSTRGKPVALPKLQQFHPWSQKSYFCAKVLIEPDAAQKKRLQKLTLRHIDKDDEEGYPVLVDQTLVQMEAIQLIRKALGDAHKEGANVTGAALTGGGDTRLLLACSSRDLQQRLLYTTHKVQRTDWVIAHWIAKNFRLQHQSFRPIRNAKTHRQMLHEQIPLRQRRRQKDCFNHRRKRQQYDDDIPQYKIHGRFGTELLGFLCYDKSSVPYPTLQELESDTPRIQKLLQFAFVQNTLDDGIEDPVASLRDAFVSLESQREHLDGCLDVAFALQIQHFTRAFFCDIYGGLRRGSWFAMPSSFFVRNSFSPFLDAKLLRLLLCYVPPSRKTLAYQWYGELYQKVPSLFRQVPCNNKLLCMYASIPRAIKQPESPKPTYQPTTLLSAANKIILTKEDNNNNNNNAPEPGQKDWLQDIQQHIHPVLWKATCLLAREEAKRKDSSATSSNIVLDINDRRPPIRSLVQAVGAEDASSLVSRMLSFLLWCEARLP